MTFWHYLAIFFVYIHVGTIIIAVGYGGKDEFIEALQCDNEPLYSVFIWPIILTIATGLFIVSAVTGK